MYESTQSNTTKPKTIKQTKQNKTNKTNKQNKNTSNNKTTKQKKVRTKHKKTCAILLTHKALVMKTQWALALSGKQSTHTQHKIIGHQQKQKSTLLQFTNNCDLAVVVQKY